MQIVFGQLYKKINSLIPNLDEIGQGDGIKLKSEGFMDLSIDVLHCTNYRTLISMTHYYTQNGDLVPDPDMEIAVYHKLKQAEALTYQDTFGYRKVYEEAGKVNLGTQKDLNDFLNTWLNNLKQQGHQLETIEKKVNVSR